MENEPAMTPEIKKPDVLYHASPDRAISTFEPRAEKVRDPLEGPVIFATSDKAYASCFIVPTDDSWVKISRFSTETERGSWKVIISDRDRFAQLDKGGAIYSLPATSFSSDPHRNMAGIEWTSRETVVPSDSAEYESGLAAMQGFGVEVYFVESATLDAINQSDDHGQAIIASITPVS